MNFNVGLSTQILTRICDYNKGHQSSKELYNRVTTFSLMDEAARDFCLFTWRQAIS
jgi:hypothetical protein